MVMVSTIAAVVLSGGGAQAAPRRAAATRPCQTSVGKAIRPTSAVISALGKTYRVVRVARGRDGSIGTPPLTRRGKTLVGWDPHDRPGNGRGSVVLDAHTWPDGSALGNALLRHLRKGSTVLLSNKNGRAVCYRITKRHSYPRAHLPRHQMFRTGGKEQLVIVVCSGRRLGPENWLRRTVWWGEPIGLPTDAA
jgi:hypothetical protein